MPHSTALACRDAFHGELRTHAIGRERTVTCRVPDLPPDLLAVERFMSTPRVRIVGERAGHPIRGAWQPGAPGLRSRR